MTDPDLPTTAVRADANRANRKAEGVRIAQRQSLRRVAHGAGMFLREVFIVVGLALVLALVAKTWLVQSFYIPSGSMMNTLAQDDRVIVSKLTPNPVGLNRGDVVVFEDPGHWLPERLSEAGDQGGTGKIRQVLTWLGLMPSDTGNHLIKRVIGLPGDRVTCCAKDGRLMVNGVAITEPYLYPGDEPSQMPFDITVPAGKIWVMGDHRSDSSDSRFHDTADESGHPGQASAPTTAAEDASNKTGRYGSVPVDRVVGKAMAVILPLSKIGGLGVGSEVFGNVPAASPVSSAPSAPTGSDAAQP